MALRGLPRALQRHEEQALVVADGSFVKKINIYAIIVCGLENNAYIVNK